MAVRWEYLILSVNARTVGDVGLGAATFKVSNGWMVQYDAESSGNCMSEVLASVATD
jgi:hypothetical protein